MIHLQEIQRQRRQRGLPVIPISRHLVFCGNPGTGKTTVARLLAEIYGEMGILSQGQLIEAERADLVAGYVGQTALKTKAVIERALGGVLFIDEAYSLAADDYGQESIDTLVKAMEDHRDELVVIAAGYTEPMQRFLDSNPGLRSRFQKYIRFEDFTGAELQEIFRKMCRDAGYIPAPQTLSYVSEVFGDGVPGNARDVRSFFQAAVSRQADRLYGAAGLTDEELCSLEPEDVAGLTI